MSCRNLACVSRNPCYFKARLTTDFAEKHFAEGEIGDLSEASETMKMYPLAFMETLL